MNTYHTTKKILKQKPKNIKIVSATDPSVKDTINEKIMKDDYLDMMGRFCRYCEQHRRYPNYIITKKSKTKVSLRLFTFCVLKIEKFIKENGTLPKWCIFNKGDVQNNNTNNKNDTKKPIKSTSNCANPYISAPHLLTTKTGLGQNYNWDCSANAVQQCLYKLSGKTIKEDALIKAGGVTTVGVGHQGINTMIAWFNKKYNTNYKVTWKNFSDLSTNRDGRFLALAKLLCKPNIAVLCHIGYANSGEKPITKNSKIFGHYEVLNCINVKQKKVQALNSLGNKINSHAYAGHLQWRTYETQASFFANTPHQQKAICIIQK